MPVATDYPYGIDMSRFQYSADGTVLFDFDKLMQHPDGPKFIGIRAGISWGYTDPWFARSFAEAKRVGLYRLPYHVPYFGESAQAQADHFFRITASADWCHDRAVLDCEVAGLNSKATITATTSRILEICKARTGRYPLIYSRKGWVDQYMSVADLPKVDWWLANYLTALPYPAFTPEKDPPPLLPVGVTEWVIHQTASNGDGKTHGAASHWIDQNRYNGTQKSLDAYFGYIEKTIEERVSECEKRIAALEVQAHSHVNLPIVLNGGA